MLVAAVAPVSIKEGCPAKPRIVRIPSAMGTTRVSPQTMTPPATPTVNVGRALGRRLNCFKSFSHRALLLMAAIYTVLGSRVMRAYDLGLR